MLEFIEANAFLAIGFGFCGAVCVYAAFGEEVGAAACDYQGCPAVAVGSVRVGSLELLVGWCWVWHAWGGWTCGCLREV